MKIKAIDEQKIEITGKFSSYDNYVSIKESIEGLIAQEADTIELEFIDAISITSTLIGYLIKLNNVDNLRVILSIHNERLIQLLCHLGLDQAFEIKKP